MGGIVLQIWVFSVGLAGSVPPPPGVEKERTEKAAQAKMTAETTSILLTKHVSIVCLTS
jgi:hypothetical protein